jgi:hypothetical protein
MRTETELNLDAMEKKTLLDLFLEFKRHIRLTSKKYGLSVKDGKLLKAYAINKAVAIEERAEGNIEEAQKYEAICERIYKELSAQAKW